MFTGLRARIAVCVVAALSLIVTVAAPASAATHYYAWTTNRAAFGSVYYTWDSCNTAGYCHIKVWNILVDDRQCGDGWGALLLLHYNDTRVHQLAYSRDCSEGSDPGVDDTGFKNVWFEVCNYNPSTWQLASCARLHA